MLLKNLKIYSWLLDFCDSIGFYNSLINKLSAKIQEDTLFYDIARAHINKNLPDDNYWHPVVEYFDKHPHFSWQPNHQYFFYADHEKEDRWHLGKNLECSLYAGFEYVFSMWLWLPECLVALKKYYPVLNIEFGELELKFLDFWIQVFPIFEDFLNHLNMNNTPFRKPYGTFSVLVMFRGGVVEPLIMYPPLKENIDFSAHLETYYFGQNGIPLFLELIAFYLDNRPKLKNECKAAWELDNKTNKKVSSNLSIYFISNFLLKNISEETLRFIVANTPISAIKPIKQIQNRLFDDWWAYKETTRQYSLENDRNVLHKKLFPTINK